MNREYVYKTERVASRVHNCIMSILVKSPGDQISSQPNIQVGVKAVSV